MKPVVLTIAGFDPSGGAGILRDVRTIEETGCEARAAVAALTIQDRHRFMGFEAVASELLEAQVSAVTRAANPVAVKVGMLGSSANCKTTALCIADMDPAPHVVVDPLLSASAGGDLTDDPALDTLRESLFHLATLVTPNVPEASVLAHRDIFDMSDMEAAARAILATGAGAVLLKGGHMKGEVVTDLLALPGERLIRMEHERLDAGIHGSGCLLSSAIAAHLALGRNIEDAVRLSVDRVTDEIKRQD